MAPSEYYIGLSHSKKKYAMGFQELLLMAFYTWLYKGLSYSQWVVKRSGYKDYPSYKAAYVNKSNPQLFSGTDNGHISIDTGGISVHKFTN